MEQFLLLLSLGAKEGHLSFLFLLSFSCSGTYEKRSRGNKKRRRRQKTDCNFSDANCQVAAVPPCLSMCTVSDVVHAVVGRNLSLAPLLQIQKRDFSFSCVSSFPFKKKCQAAFITSCCHSPPACDLISRGGRQ